MDTNVIVTLLSQMPEDQAMRVRIEHTLELIIVMSKYCQEKPEHAEYYESVISHLQTVSQTYHELLEGNKAKCQNQVH